MCLSLTCSRNVHAVVDDENNNELAKHLIKDKIKLTDHRIMDHILDVHKVLAHEIDLTNLQ